MVRDSGKSVSTSSANYFPNDSGKRFYHTCMNEDDMIHFNNGSKSKVIGYEPAVIIGRNSGKIMGKRDRPSNFFK